MTSQPHFEELLSFSQQEYTGSERDATERFHFRFGTCAVCQHQFFFFSIITHPHNTIAALRQPDESWDSSGALPHYFTFKEPLCSLEGWGGPSGSFVLWCVTVGFFCRAACCHCGPQKHKHRKAGPATRLIHSLIHSLIHFLSETSSKSTVGPCTVNKNMLWIFEYTLNDLPGRTRLRFLFFSSSSRHPLTGCCGIIT